MHLLGCGASVEESLWQQKFGHATLGVKYQVEYRQTDEVNNLKGDF